MRQEEPITGAGPSGNSLTRIVRILNDAAARVIVIEEALEDGDTSMAYTVARDLELDLRAAVSGLEVPA